MILKHDEVLVLVFCRAIEIRVHRITIMEDMINAFAGEEVLNANLSFVMIDNRGKEEMGEDTGGIIQDAYSGFWQSFYDRCSIGEDQRVPALQVMQRQSIARILVKGYLHVKYFPFLISNVFITSMLFGEGSVSEDSLISSFKQYVANDEAQILNDVLASNKNPDNEDVINFIGRFGCRKLPNTDNMHFIVLEMAHQELIQKLQYVVDCWAPICKQWLRLKGVGDIDMLFEKIRPTNHEVLDLVRPAAPITNKAEKDALDYLTRFIRGLNQQDLSSFVRFITSSDMICVNKISVQFTSLEGFEWRPIAHTCGAVLELPRMYESFPQLRQEFNSILHKYHH